jgi:lipid-A-disaccharide synthase
MRPPRARDHLRVAGLLGWTLLGIVPVLLWVPLSPILKPWARRRLRRRLEAPPPPPAAPPPVDPARWAGRTVYLVAGEESGDRIAARVVAAMRRQAPGLRVRGLAGPASRAAGADLDEDIVARAVMGIVAVVASLPTWWRILAGVSATLGEDPPDLLLTVDFPGLNARLARWARRAGVPTVHLVAPAVWAYLPWRLFRWRRAVDRLLTTFPYEAQLFERSGIPSAFVGHPLFEAPLAAPRTAPEPPEGPARVELYPGSRRREVEAHAPVLIDAAARLDLQRPDLSFDVRLARPEDEPAFRRALEAAPRRPARLSFSPSALPLLGALSASGTVTAELGAALVPLALFYRVPWWTRLGALVLLTTPWIGLVNLTAGREVVPEHVQTSRSGRRLARRFLDAVGDPARWRRTRAALEAVRARLGAPDVAERAARAVLASGGHAPASAAPVGEPGTARRPAGGPS